MPSIRSRFGEILPQYYPNVFITVHGRNHRSSAVLKKYNLLSIFLDLLQEKTPNNNVEGNDEDENEKSSSTLTIVALPVALIAGAIIVLIF